MTITTEPATTHYNNIPLHLIYYDNHTLNITITTLTFLLGSVILLLNAILCSYYYRRKSVIYEKLFLCLSVVDATTGVAALLQCFTFLGILTNSKQFVSVILMITYILSAVCFHVSVFYNVLLAVCRTIVLVCPFFSFHLILLYTISALYLVFMLVLSVYEVSSVYSNYSSLVDKIRYLLVSPLCGAEIIYNYLPDFNDLGYYVLLLGVPFVLPSLICLFCCVFASVFLWRSSKKDASRMRYRLESLKTGDKPAKRILRKTNSRATVTILQLTSAFFICNTLYFTTEFTLEVWDPEHFAHEAYLVYLAANFLPFLNSLINPVILIYRGTSLQNHLKKSFKEFQQKFISLEKTV